MEKPSDGNVASRKIVELIHSQRITPLPRWIFRMIAVSRWMSFASIGLFSGFSLFLLFSDLSFQTGGRIGWILAGLPYAWIFLLGLVGPILFFQFRRTPRGYRYSTSRILAVIVLFSSLSGGVMTLTGFNSWLEFQLSSPVSVLRQYQRRLQMRWGNPDAGVLFGEWVDWSPSAPVKPDSKFFQVKDRHGKVWDVRLENAKWRGMPRILAEGRVRVMGNRISERDFVGEMVTPWPGREFGRHLEIGRGHGEPACNEGR